MGISDKTFYRWKAKYGGLEVSEAERLRQLEEENLGYHLKTGHTLSVQNRPTGLAEDVIVLPCFSA